MEHDTAQRAAEATETLQKARRGLEQLQRDEEKYLADRESKAQALLAGLHKRIGSATTLLKSVTDKIGKKADELTERVETFARGLYSILDRAKTAAEKTERALTTAKHTLGIYEDLTRQLRDKIAEVSAWEKNVKKREEEATRQLAEAEEKLQEARDLADWHNSGKRYTIKKK